MVVLSAERESPQQQRQAFAPAATRPLGCGRLKDVSRKAFDAAVRSRQDNGFKRTYQRSLETTHDKTHARLTVQRKIVSTLRAVWLRRTPYSDELIR